MEHSGRAIRAAWLVCLGGLIFSVGCAHLGVRPAPLNVSLWPAKIYPGTVVTLRVEAPLGTRDVRGRLDLPGSPQLPLRSGDQGRTWTFTTQIPLGSVLVPGKYRGLVEGLGPAGERLAGETWIEVP